MDRRDFLKRLMAASVAVPVVGSALVEIDWERLLWTPKAMITVPGPALTLDQINAITLKEIMPGLTDTFFKAFPLLQYLREHRARRLEGSRLLQNPASV